MDAPRRFTRGSSKMREEKTALGQATKPTMTTISKRASVEHEQSAMNRKDIISTDASSISGKLYDIQESVNNGNQDSNTPVASTTSNAGTLYPIVPTVDELAPIDRIAKYIRTSTLCNPSNDYGSNYSLSVSASDVLANESNNQGLWENDNTTIPGETNRGFCKENKGHIIDKQRNIKVPKEFGGGWGALLLMLLIPGTVIYLHWCCSKSGCQLKMPIWREIARFENYEKLATKLFNQNLIGTYLLYLCSIYTLSTILPGMKVRMPDGLMNSFTSFPLTIVALLCVYGGESTGYPVHKFIMDYFDQFGIYGILNAYITALFVYMYSYFAKETDEIQGGENNPYGRTGNIIIDYALGRKINYRWFHSASLKLVLYRCSLVTCIIYTVCLLMKLLRFNFNDIGLHAIMKSPYNTAIIASLLLFVYLIDMIIFEYHLASSFELEGEGLGCLLLLRYAVTPYLLTAVPRYLYTNTVTYKCKFTPIAPTILLLLGLFLKRISNSKKYQYRLYQNSKAFLDAYIVNTFLKRRILLHSTWKYLRQPNYLGDILALIALAMPMYIQFAAPPIICLGLLILLLIHRCGRVNARNAERYKSSWECYCQEVPNYLIPRIY